MSATYNDVLERLKEERNRLLLSQNEMARIVHMTQSNYSKVELGLRRLGYDELKYLCESQLDVYYIFTGCRSSRKYMEFLLQCDYSELCCYLSIIYSVANKKHFNHSILSPVVSIFSFIFGHFPNYRPFSYLRIISYKSPYF